MRNLLAHTGIKLLLTVLSVCLLLPSCVDPKGEARFLVNLQKENSDFFVAPAGGEFQLFVESDLEWTYSIKTPAVWLQAREQKVNSNSWAVVLTVSENKGEAPRQAVILFSAEGHSVEVTVRQEPEDPVLRVTVPGAYGAEGGTLVYERGSTQISRFTEADVFRFSLLFPEQVKAAVIQVPASLEEGQRVSVGYKGVEKDRTLVSTSYPNALVLRVKDGFVWIKLREDLYFVIKK